MSEKQKGILYILISAASFALMNFFVQLAGDLGSMQKSFFRNLVSLIFAAILLLRSRSFAFEKRNLKYLLLRSALGTLGILCNYYALGHLLLSDATMLGKLSPFFTLIFSFLFLNERIRPFQMAGILTAFIGSLFIIKPGFDTAAFLPAIIGVAGAMAAGAAYTCVRFLGLRGERGPFIVFFFSAFSCLFTLPSLILNFHPMTGKQLIFLLCAGLAASGGQFGITAAYKHAPSKEISIYDYTMVLWAALLGFFAFGQIPDSYSFIGYTIIFTIAVLMYLYNNGRIQPYRKDLQ